MADDKSKLPLDEMVAFRLTRIEAAAIMYALSERDDEGHCVAFNSACDGIVSRLQHFDICPIGVFVRVLKEKF